MNDKHDALVNIKYQLDNGYLDISEVYDEEEMNIIRQAIEDYENNHEEDL